jgi:hypothetical protein
MMRYGCYRAYAPALLPGGVVARAEGALLVSPAGFADAAAPLHLGAGGRATTVPPIAPSADEDEASAMGAVENALAFVDGAAPAIEDWTKPAPLAIIRVNVGVIALAVAQKPRPFA